MKRRRPTVLVASRGRRSLPMGHTAYQHVGHTAYQHVGDAPAVVPNPAPPDPNTLAAVTWTDNTGQPGGVSLTYQPDTSFWGLVRLGVITLAAYHGYRRNSSIGWAVAWAFMAGIAPPVVIGVAFAQGFGDRRGASS